MMRIDGHGTVAPIAGAVLTAAMVVGIGGAVWSLPVTAEGLAGPAAVELDRAGTINPVTAVLLNYRSYDTLLEIAVLLVAVWAALALVGGWAGGVPRASEAHNPVLRGFVRVLTPVMMLVAGYLLWVGGHAPGGAFQAGAVLASAGVLLFLAGVDWGRKLPLWAERGLLTAGLATFLAVGVGMMALGGRFLEYPSEAAKWWILVIEAPCGLSIAAALIALSLGGRLRTRRTPAEERLG
jgi:multisubunit Na+/H+ antiporter MnhB subunit